MSADSKIEWTHHTFNPWWGCQRVSPGCEHCYAEAFSHRLGRDLWGPKAERRMQSESYWQEPIGWDRQAMRAGERRRVFCASMADVFEDREELRAPRARLFNLIDNTPHLDWLLLTKRPENADRLWAGALVDAYDGSESVGPRWRSNVWLGTTIEDQKRADERLPEIAEVPAAVKFLSCEPLLERVDLGSLYTIDWVIIGGESGPGARPFDLAWARAIVDRCRGTGAKPFVKQLGALAIDSDYRAGTHAEHDKRSIAAAKALGLSHVGFNLRLTRDRKGGDIDEWPEDLRVREFPRSAA